MFKKNHKPDVPPTKNALPRTPKPERLFRPLIFIVVLSISSTVVISYCLWLIQPNNGECTIDLKQWSVKCQADRKLSSNEKDR